MKKSLIAISLLLLGAASLPIIGNSLLKNKLDEKVVELHAHGINTQKDMTNSSYLNTVRHFEFVLEDSQEFLDYLSRYSDKQLPSYTKALLDGVSFGVDVEYSNLPFAKAIVLDIYPISLSEVLEKNIRESDPEFLGYLEKFLAAKGLLYHIEYNFLNADFKGTIKDIDVAYEIDKDNRYRVVLKGTTFSGNGELLAPKRLDTRFKEMVLTIEEDKRSVDIFLKNFKTTNNFDSKITYLTSVELQEAGMETKGTDDDGRLVIDAMRVNASSNAQGETVELNSKFSVKKLEITTQSSAAVVEKFNLDIALNKLNKKAVMKITDLLSDNNSMQSSTVDRELQNYSIALLSKGLEFNVADLSLRKMTIVEDTTEKNLKGFSIKSKTTFRADPALEDKINRSPLLLVDNLTIESDMKFSKEIYAVATQGRPMLASFRTLAQEQGDKLLYKVELKNSKLSVNGKALN